MESRCCASAASDHSESTASSHDQHCPQMSQQVMFNTPSHGHSHHLPGHGHVLPQHSRMAVPQHYITAEQNMHYGQAQQQTLANHPAVCSALTSSVQPNIQTYPEVESRQRHNSSHEPAPVYGSVFGQVHHSPKAMHQNVEGMLISGHAPGGEGHMLHGGYYPVPHHAQHVQNNGPSSWQSQRHYMPPGGQGQVFVSGIQPRFNSQVPVPFRGQRPQYALNQEYGEVYCQQYHPAYSELSSSSPRSTFPPQQQCVVPNGQRIMFARHAMHVPQHHPHMPADAQFVYCGPHSGSGVGQQMSPPSWSGSSQMMRSGVPVGYGNQPAWHRPMAVVYSSPLQGQHMPDCHVSPKPRMTAEFCDNFGGARQHPSPSHSFSPPGSVRCYRPSSNQGVGVAYVDDKYAGACHAPTDSNRNTTLASQEYVSPVITTTDVSTAMTCSTAGSDMSSKDGTVLTYTTSASHPLEHLPDGRQSLSHNSYASGTTVSSLPSYNQTGYYSHGTNVTGSCPVSAAGEYYAYNALSQYQHHPHTGRHINPYNYYVSPPHVQYSGNPHYLSARYRHPYPSPVEGMQWCDQLTEHPLHECRNVLPDKVASHHHVEQEALTTVAVATCSESVNVKCSAVNVCSAVFSASIPVTSWKVDKQNHDNADGVSVTKTFPVQSAATHVGNHVSFSGSAYHVKDHITSCPSVARSLNYSPISQAVVSATDAVVTMPASAVDSTSMISSNDAADPLMNKHIFSVRDKATENEVAAGTESQNCRQIASSTLSSTCNSSKGPKRNRSRKGTKKTKKRKADCPLDTDGFGMGTVAVTCADAVNNLCSATDNISAATSTKTTVPLAVSIDHFCPVSSNCSEQTAVVVPYGWRRDIDSGTVVYYRLHSLILLMLIVL